MAQDTTVVAVLPGSDHGKDKSSLQVELPPTPNPSQESSLKQTDTSRRRTGSNFLSLSLSQKEEKPREEEAEANSGRRKEEKPREEEEANSRRRKKKGGWKTMPFIIANEACERMATAGLTANMIIYLTKKFNMPNVAAASVINIWTGCCSLSPVLGAFLADSYIGKYRTILLGCIASFLGMAMFASTSIFPNLRPPNCISDGSICRRANAVQNTVLYSSLALMTLGSAGIKPCSIAFGADQFDSNNEKSRRRIQSFFNWYYFTFTISAMVALSLVVYIQSNISWSLGLAIPTSLMLLSTLCFVAGKCLYILVKPEGSPFKGLAQVLVAAYRKRHLQHPSDSSLYYGSSKSKLPVTQQFRILSKAAIMEAENEEEEDAWRLCSVEQVEELKCVIRILPVWAGSILVVLTGAQLVTFSVLQANIMDRRLSKGKNSFSVPAGSFMIFSMLSFALFLPIYDKLAVPYLRKLTNDGTGLTQLQRIGVGQALAVFPMVAAALVEARRRHVAVQHGLLEKPNSMVPMSAMWLLPQYCITGLGEAFLVVGSNEFLYSQFPPNMRSVAGALNAITFGIGNLLSSFFVNVVNSSTNTGHHHHSWLDQNLNQAKLDYFYWLLAALNILSLLYFFILARWYTYRPLPTSTTTTTHHQNSSDQDQNANSLP